MDASTTFSDENNNDKEKTVKNKFDNYEYDSISNEVWHDNYKAPNEKHREEVWKRTAEACASIEAPEIKEQIKQEFLEALYNDKFVPGGRILANIGIPSRTGTTLYNCFVDSILDKDLKNADSIDGIYDMLKAQAKTLKSEGGYGINASWIRPEGAYVRGIGARTPGVLKFMELWDKSSQIITQGSQKLLGGLKKDEKNKIRKGAQMLVLDVWHPDIEEFIIAKQTEGRLTKFNISVGITEGFMEAVITDSDWNLIFPDTEHPLYNEEWRGDINLWKEKNLPIIIHKTVKARELWDSITKATYNRNEPGVLFLDIANKLNPLHWADIIKTTNPCFAGDTLIAVADGRNAVSIKQLAAEGVDVPVYSLNQKTGLVEIKMGRNPRITDYNQKLLRITLDNGTYFDVTPNHKMLLKNGQSIEAKDLKYGDSLPSFSKNCEKMKNESDSFYYSVKANNINVNRVFEHRLIAQYYYPETWAQKYNKEKENGWLKGGLVVHHKDYDGLNNKPENLKIMTFKEHQKFHADHDCAGEKNGRFLGNSSEEIYQYGITLTKKFGRKFSGAEWREYAGENNLPVTFSKMHHKILGKKPTELAKLCAIELGYNFIDADPRALEFLKKIIQEGYEAEILNGNVHVKKECEGCSSKFSVLYGKREISFCSQECYKQNGMQEYYQKRAESNKEIQAKIWSQLRFDLRRNPHKKEWEKSCKENNIPYRIGPSLKNGFQSYEEVCVAGENYNHKVISIEEMSDLHTVYNITVDDNHTLAIINRIKNKRDQENYKGVFVRNCGEVCMSLGVCNLASINLPMFVKHEETGLQFDFDDFANTVRVGVRFLDNINDISTTPLPDYTKSVKDKRRIGLGVMGLGSLKMMLGIKYGSKESLELSYKIFKLKAETEILTSAKLGQEKGSFELFDKEKYFSSFWWKNLQISNEVKKEVESLGTMRNSHQSMNAPTGNTGVYARNVSGGIEPVFSLEYIRWVIVPDAKRRTLIEKGFKIPDVSKNEWYETEHLKFSKKGDEQILKGSFNGKDYEIDKNRGLIVASLVQDYGYKFAKKYYGDKFDNMKEKGLFNTTTELSTSDHIEVLEKVAHYVNMSISKTLNFPNDYPYEDFQDVYLQAWKANIKGVTTYRAGTMTAVLESVSDKTVNKTEKQNFIETHAPKRPVELPCDIYHMQVRGEKWNFFIGLYDDKPYEIFAGRAQQIYLPKSRKSGFIKKNGKYSLYTGEGENELIIQDLATIFDNPTESAFTRTVSLALRHGVPVQFVVEQIEKGADEDMDMFSLSKGLARVLKRYILDGTKPTTKNCASCSSANLIYQEGCLLCRDCGYSKCG